MFPLAVTAPEMALPCHGHICAHVAVESQLQRLPDPPGGLLPTKPFLTCSMRWFSWSSRTNLDLHSSFTHSSDCGLRKGPGTLCYLLVSSSAVWPSDILIVRV